MTTNVKSVSLNEGWLKKKQTVKDGDKSRESAAKESQRAPGMKDKCAWKRGGELRDPGSERDAEKEQKKSLI